MLPHIILKTHKDVVRAGTANDGPCLFLIPPKSLLLRQNHQLVGNPWPASSLQPEQISFAPRTLTAALTHSSRLDCLKKLSSSELSHTLIPAFSNASFFALMPSIVTPAHASVTTCVTKPSSAACNAVKATQTSNARPTT